MRWQSVGLMAIAARLATVPQHVTVQEPIFRTSTQQVVVHASVQDRTGRFVPGLEAEDFTVQIDGRPAPIVLFDRTSQPLAVALLIELRQENSALRRITLANRLVDALGPADKAVVGTYGQETAVGPVMTGDRAVLHRTIAEEVWPRDSPQGAPVNTALVRAVELLGRESLRRVVVVIGQTVGACTPKSFVECIPTERVRRVLIERDALLMFIRPPFMHYDAHDRQLRVLDDYPRPDNEGWLQVHDLLGAVGGLELFIRDDEDAAEWAQALVQGLRERYLLAVESPVADGREHKIEVRTRASDLRVTARTRFIASGSGP